MTEKRLDLVEALRECDLEEEFWLQLFAVMRVKSVEALNHLQAAALSTLYNNTRYSSEKKNLQNLLKHVERQEAIKQQAAKGKMEMDIKGEREYEERKTRPVLEKARSDRNDRPDKQLQKFRIIPTALVSSKKSLQKLEPQLIKGRQTANELDNFTLLQRVSGGRALQGVLLTKNLSDWQKERAYLLKVPENVSIASLQEDFASFSSMQQKDSYRFTRDILCHSVAVPVQTTVYRAVPLGTGLSESTITEEHAATKQKIYSSTIKYSSMHLASFTFGNSDLKLSEEAKEYLKIIIKKKARKSKKIQRACEKFFHTYGSHVNQGPLQFGGNYWLTCSSHCVDTEELEAVKKLQSEAVTTSADVSSRVVFDSIKSKYAGKCSESTLASTQLEMNVKGGPSEVSDLSVWKDALVANNSTWIITDQGCKLVAIWDVIRINHQEEFGEIQEELRMAWEKMTGLESEPDFMPNLGSDSKDALGEMNRFPGEEQGRYPKKLSMPVVPSSENQSSSYIGDFDSLFSYLKKTVEEIKFAQLNPSETLLGPAGSIHSYDMFVATNVSQAICSLQSNYQATYDEILIKILAFPFQNVGSCDVIALHPLSLQDLESLLLKFTEGREKYTAAGASALQKQSLLFLLAASGYTKQQESHFRLHLGKVVEMMEVLEPPLEAVLRKVIKSYLSGSYQLSKLKTNLDSLLTTGYLPISLLDLLSTAAMDVDTDNVTIPVIQSDHQEAHSLLSKLGLTEHYHKKLGLQDALCIRSEPLRMTLKMSYPTEPSQLPFLALQKLMSFDGQCRSVLMEGCRSKGKSDNNNKINPYDILLALIICSDHFLRQELFARLAKCQYAVPFILPDPFTKELLLPLWAMRSITKEWKCLQTIKEEKKIVEHTSSIIDYRMPIVSFLRLGKSLRRKPKSKILNQVIGDSEHFFYRGLPGGSFKQVLGDGLVDMSWYLPSGIEDDVFPDAVTFLNLHGDTRSHPKQSRFLSQISSMCFILVTEEDLELNEEDLKTLEYFSSSAGGITLLIKGDEAPEALMKESLSVTSIKLLMGAADITAEIQHQICRNFFAEKQQIMTTTIEECCMKPGKDIHVDEDNDFFKNGRDQAMEVVSLVQEDKSIKLSAKEEMLPLQGGNLWQAWGALNQMEYREACNCKPDIERKNVSILSKRCEFVESLTPVMERIIRFLLALEDKTAKNCFLQHLILNLDNLSEKCLSGLFKQYQAIQEEISQLELPTGNTQTKGKARKNSGGKLDVCRGKLKELRNDMVKASLGLHHLLRELGQVYEAACEDSSKYGDKLSRLPKVAAEHLLDGYPLELMDGDAAHVPLKWIQAVMSELNKKLNDPHMFVLSVLGLQSTGKSTMLNTVFGLTFKTSAGRCTHGAFMQLLPVDKTIEADTGYSYVLVIDTKGLDSSQSHRQGNELATFIIGLANLTFINIYGEVTGDLDEILRSTLRTFLRVNPVELHPSCQFVHQNLFVEDIMGRDCFVERLDQWTLDAAQEEGCVGQHERFSDVIKFDYQKDFHYFPGLWEGEPPMAPISQQYSQAAQRLKFNLLQKLHREAKSTNVSSFQNKINHLWNALLKEQLQK